MPLTHNATADVCVIGAGISGLSVAYELTLLGASVIVLERGHIGHGQTGNTTAHLVTCLDERYFELERMHGSAAAAVARESHAAAIDRIESIADEEDIDCRFTRLEGYLFASPSRPNREELLAREFDAAIRAGAIASRLSYTPGLDDALPCLAFPRQAQLHPALYLEGLARAIRTHRGRIFTGVQVVDLEGAATPVISTSSHHTIRAGAAIIATNQPLRAPNSPYPAQTPIRSFVIAMKIPPGAMKPALYWDGYWDTGDAYHYVRVASSTPDGENDLLLIGGEDEEIDEQTLTPHDRDARHERLREWTLRHFPFAHEVSHRWHGRILEPEDEFAFIGRLKPEEPNVYVISGDSGNGMTYAAIAGMILRDLISGRDHPWAQLYSPQRRKPEKRTRRQAHRTAAALQ